MDAEFDAPLQELATNLTQQGVSYRLDDSGAGIGRRYARTDEIAIPFGVTVDFQTKTDGRATLRERNSMLQVRAPLGEIPGVVAELANGRLAWEVVVARYGLVSPPADKAADS